MSHWLGGYRAFIIEIFCKSGTSYVSARSIFCLHYNIRRLSDGSNVNLIRLRVQKFRTTSLALNIPQSGPSRTLRTTEDIQLVPKNIVHEILKKNLTFCIGTIFEGKQLLTY